MDTTPQQNGRELELRHLQIFEVLLHERSLTKAARVLDLTQPALSKTLARLRLYFNDPLLSKLLEKTAWRSGRTSARSAAGGHLGWGTP